MEVASLTSFLVTMMCAQVVLITPKGMKELVVIAAVIFCSLAHANFIFRTTWLFVHNRVISAAPQPIRKYMEPDGYSKITFDFDNHRMEVHGLSQGSRSYLALVL